MITTARTDAMVKAGNRSQQAARRAAGDVARNPASFEEFGSLVFGRKEMQERLPDKVFKNLIDAMEGRGMLKPEHADPIAVAMKDWALHHGATHFTHWFQPLTGISAEKHDSFLDWSSTDQVIDKFNGSQLLQGEPDASSFPSGGLRSTYEARGYTGWDPTSPAFLWRGGDGVTLFIPSVFYSWTGDVLDSKIPLIRSGHRLQSAVLRMLAATGSKEATQAFTTLGMEQEYFVIDRALRNLRPDLVLGGRTVFGAPSPKGQELQDHYFGSVKDRILRYMRSFEEEAWRLGIPVKTRHNEVAPAQHEVAPVFEPSTRAVDHNLMLMELMRQHAIKHDLSCLLHEKPFKGLNGSGKHMNWSISTDQGANLLNPANSDPADRMHFLILLAAFLRGVHRHSALLSSSIASSGNDHRLGGDEAPPAIMSVYLGEDLDRFIDAFIEKGAHAAAFDKGVQDVGIPNLPQLPRDNTDRNRTSPIAFTGSKFEFRAVGSSANPGWPATVLNAVVAESLEFILARIADALGGEGKHSLADLTTAAIPVLQEVFDKASPIRYSGDNYSAEWMEMARERGLPSVKQAHASLAALVEPSSVELFEGILSQSELESRLEIGLTTYVQISNIEVSLMLDMFQTQIVPAVIRYQTMLAEALERLRKVTDKRSSVQEELIEKVVHSLDRAILLEDEVVRARQEAQAMDLAAMAEHFAKSVMPKAERLRDTVDYLESIVDDQLWPLPKYRELLFMV